MAAVNLRFRIVTEQDSHAHISSVILTEEEALENLTLEVFLARLAGWDVNVVLADTVTEMVAHCRSPRGVERTLSVLATSPWEDLHGAL